MLTALLVVAGVLAGVVAALKIIAPLTKTTKDDTVLKYAEDAEKMVDEAKDAVAPVAK